MDAFSGSFILVKNYYFLCKLSSKTLTNSLSLNRLYGTYESLHSGFTTKALQDLTGGIVQSFSLSTQDRLLTYQVLNSAVPRSTLLIASINIVSNCYIGSLLVYHNHRKHLIHWLIASICKHIKTPFYTSSLLSIVYRY